MRTTDDLQEPERFKPLGEKINRTAPDLRPEWRPRPGSPGIEENAEGKVRTTDMAKPLVPPTRVP